MKDIIQYFKDKQIVNDNWLMQLFENVNEYTDIRNYTTIGLPKYDVWQNYLYERLGDSFQIDDHALNILKSINGIQKVNIINAFRLNFIYNDNFSFENKIFKSFTNFYNYSIIRNKNNECDLEARKPIDCTRLSLPYVIHITTKNAYQKIKRQGLIPKIASKINKSKNDDYEYPKHVYVMSNTINNVDLLMYANMLKRINNKYDETVFLKIDTKKFMEDHNNTALRFYGDPSSLGSPAMFTEEPIPSKYISQYDIKIRYKK